MEAMALAMRKKILLKAQIMGLDKKTEEDVFRKQRTRNRYCATVFWIKENVAKKMAISVPLKMMARMYSNPLTPGTANLSKIGFVLTAQKMLILSLIHI